MGINKFYTALLLIVCSITLTTCQNKKMEEKFQWLATLSAPQEYPMEIYDGALIANDFTYDFDAIWGTQNTGWGNSGGTMNVSTEQMQIPHSLEFTYLSLVEKKMYTGRWSLDKMKIENLFKSGFIDLNNGNRVTYNEFKIGLAPKGRVVLWISGNGRQKEVGSFQAHDTIITKETSYEGAEYMFDEEYISDRLKSDFLINTETKNRINKDGMPDPMIYDFYRKKYLWKPVIELPVGYKVKDIYLMTSNGEFESYNYEKFIERATPFSLSITIIDSENKKHGANIYFTKNQNHYNENIRNGNNVIPIDFDLNQINEIFRDEMNLKTELDLVITIDPRNKDLQMKLQQGEKSFKLKDFISKIY